MEKSTIQKLIAGIKRYLCLQRDYVMLSLAEKLTLVLSALVVGCVLLVLALLVLIFLSMAVSDLLASVVGSAALANAIVAAFYLLLALLVYANRHRWVANSVANLIATILIDKPDDADSDSEY